MNEQLRNPDPDLAGVLGLEVKPRRLWTSARLAILALIVTGLAAALAFYLWRASPPTAYLTAPASRGALVVTVSATGTLQPQDQVDVGAEISGRVDQVKVDYNDRVKKGQVLAVINTDQIRGELAQAQAQLNSARATVTNNEATANETLKRRDRARGLFQIGGISQQDVQTVEAEYDRAVASVAKAKADVENAAAQVSLRRTSLGKAEVRSPIDGVVLDRKVSTGQTVAASFQTPVLFTLATDLSTMQLAVDIDEADIGSVHEGQPANFTVDAYPQRRFDARLVSLRNSPKTTNGVVTYQGVLAVDNAAMLLRPGLTATVNILVAETKDALLVPNGALRFTPSAKDANAPPLPHGANGVAMGRLWVMQGGKPVVHDVRIGRSDGRNTEILSGDLKPGDPVITDIATRATSA
jgi:HlyD family secretion protein